MTATARRLEVLEELRELLARQVAVALQQRRQMALLDGAAVLESLALREALRAPMESLIDELAERPATAELRAGLAQVKKLAAELRAIDQVNREVATHGLSAVRGMLHALAPRASAYDRQGHSAPVTAAGRRSTRA